MNSRAKGIAASLVVIGLAGAMIAWGLTRASARPSTDDATFDADIVHVAAAVAGRVIELPVRENAAVRKGDLLFQIDPEPYRLAVAQAVANLEVARAAVDTQRRIVSTQQSAVRVATEQTRRAETNLALSTRTEARLRPLTDQGYVPTQQLDQAQTAVQDAIVSIRQAQEQQRAAARAVDTVAAAEAAVQAASAALGSARRALDDTTVRALHDGRVAGLNVSTGEMVLPSQALFTLVNTEEWFAVANLRETELAAVSIGDCATVYSMIDRRQALRGEVEGIGWGVQDEDRVNLPRALPLVQPSVNWVRVAHRFPVRVRLHEPPADLVRLGASANVEIRHGASCH